MKTKFTLLFLILGTLTIFFACQKEDDSTTSNLTDNQTPLILRISGADVPHHVMSHIKNKTGNTFKVAIGHRTMTLNRNEQASRETPLGTVQTNKVIAVYNETNTKYTFQVSDPSNTNSIINLIVVDMGTEIVEYFIQYVFDDIQSVPFTDSGTIDMSRFTGAMFFYDNKGTQIGEYLMQEGILITFQGVTNPCNDDDPDDSGDVDEGDDGSGGGSGGGSDGDTDPTDDGNTDDPSGSGSNEDPYNSGTGGGEFENPDSTCMVTLIWVCQLGHQRSHDADANCPGNVNGAGEWWFRDCEGNTYNPNRGSANRDGSSPCDGNTGVLIDLNDIELRIEECLGIDISGLDLLILAQIEDYLITQNNCSEQAEREMKDFIKIKEELPDAKLERYLELIDLIEDNPWALVEDCIQQNGLNIANYQYLYNHSLPTVCVNRLELLGEEFQNQPLNEGNSAVANVDYYPVEITTNPDFNNDGIPDSNTEVYNQYRANFGDLASGGQEDFQFSCDIPFNSSDSGNVSWTFSPYFANDISSWSSNNPLATIFKIDADADIFMGGLVSDDGAIMISEFTSSYWIGSTIATEFSGTQPFSGNRQWGYIINSTGNLELYARAVDVARVSNIIRYNPLTGDECEENDYYNIGEATWSNLQDEIRQFVIDNGGQASVIPKTAIRFGKNKIKQLLESNDSIDQIPCN